MQLTDGEYRWTGALRPGTLVETPRGDSVTFHSILSMSQGEALYWFADYLT